MKLLSSTLVLLAFILVCRGQEPGTGVGGPPVISPGYLIGQEASKNAVNLAISNALATNSDASTLPPELQVKQSKIIEIIF